MTIVGLRRAAVLSGFWLLPTSNTINAQTPLQIPAYTGYVNDFAGVIPLAERSTLQGISEQVNAATKGDMVFVTMLDIGQRAPADVALTIGREWKIGANTEIGDKARNAGTVILLVPKETSSSGRGSCFIATGRGAEGFITDATAASICREATPYFQQQQYANGLLLIAARVTQRYATEFNVSIPLENAVPAPRRSQPSRSRGNGSSIFGLVVILFMAAALGGRGRRRSRGGIAGAVVDALPFIVAASQSRNRNDHWGGGFGGGGGGGGFGGFGGGGGFSGGGGGSDW